MREDQRDEDRKGAKKGESRAREGKRLCEDKRPKGKGERVREKEAQSTLAPSTSRLRSSL